MVRDTSAMLQQYKIAKGEQTSWALERGTGEGHRELLLENYRERSFEILGLGARS